MNLIVDTNIFLAVVLDEPEKASIIEVGAGYDAVSPDVLPYEIGNALSAMIKRRQLVESEAISAYGMTKMVPVKLIQTDIQKALEIAIKFNIYAYDSYFIQCAMSMNAPLLTLDKKMRSVAKELNIKVLEIP